MSSAAFWRGSTHSINIYRIYPRRSMDLLDYCKGSAKQYYLDNVAAGLGNWFRRDTPVFDYNSLDYGVMECNQSDHVGQCNEQTRLQISEHQAIGLWPQDLCNMKIRLNRRLIQISKNASLIKRYPLFLFWVSHAPQQWNKYNRRNCTKLSKVPWRGKFSSISD